MANLLLIIYVHTYSACDRASTQVLDRVRCTATYVMTMAINMKELASVSCIVKRVKFYGGINSFSSFDDLHSLTTGVSASCIVVQP